ncbi:MAG: hypothetical protein AB7I19_04785 [Planctomycetota bacterium]
MTLRSLLVGTILMGMVAVQYSPALEPPRAAQRAADSQHLVTAHRVAVILRRADGTPWADAHVHARAGYWTPGWVLPGSPQADGKSDANGRCILSLAPCTEHWIWAESATDDGKRWIADAVSLRAEKSVRLVARPDPVGPTILRLRSQEDRCARVRVRDRALGWEREFEGLPTELRLEAPPSPWLEVVVFDPESRPSLLVDVQNDGREHVIEPESTRVQEVVVVAPPAGIDPADLRLQLWHRGETFDLAAFDAQGRTRFDFDRWQGLVDGRGQCAKQSGSAYVVNGDAIDPVVIDLVWSDYRRPDTTLPIPVHVRARERTGGWFRIQLGGEELDHASLRRAVELEHAHGERRNPIRFALDERLAGRRVPLSMSLKEFPLWLTGAARSDAALARQWQPWLDGVVPILLDVPPDSASPPQIDLDLATDFVRCELTFVGVDRLPLADQFVRWWVRPSDHAWRMDVRTDPKGVARFLLPKKLTSDAWCWHVSPQGWTSFLLNELAIAEVARRTGVLRAEIQMLPVHRVRLACAEPMDVTLAVRFDDQRLDPIPAAAVSDRPEWIAVARPENALAGFREIYEFRTYRLPDDLIAVPALPLRSVIHLRSRVTDGQRPEGFRRPTNFAIEASVEPQVLEFVLEQR